MWQAIIDFLNGLVDWFKGLFGSSDSTDAFDDPSEMDGEYSFEGVIPDEPDARDQIYTGGGGGHLVDNTKVEQH